MCVCVLQQKNNNRCSSIHKADRRWLFILAEAEAWWAGFANSVDMLRTGKNTAQTFRVLDGLFNKIPHLLKNQQPRLLVAICLAAAVCAGAAPELYVHLVRHVASLSSIYLPGQHPLRLFLEAVARMSSVHFFQYAQVFVEFHLEYLEAWFGDAPERTQGVTGYRGGTYLIFANQELMDLDVAESAYDKLFKIFETMPDRNIAERRRVAAKLSSMYSKRTKPCPPPFSSLFTRRKRERKESIGYRKITD